MAIAKYRKGRFIKVRKVHQKSFWIGVCLLLAFSLFTVLVCAVDVATIGPLETHVGFATVNRFVHDATGVDLFLYTLTDWLGLVPIGTALGFAILGACQLFKRKSLLKVDRSLFVLGGFYVVVIALFLLFEAVAVNYRPVLIDGSLEASYPSSTTLLVLCVMPTAMMQLTVRIKNRVLRRVTILTIAVFIAFTVSARLLSGVHWFTDIVGGMLLSAALVTMYVSLAQHRSH